MLKRDITYEDFDGNKVTETFYFNLTKTEIIELEVNYEDGLERTLKRIIASDNRAQLIAEFQRIILLAYGERSEDGKRFVKSDELRNGFKQTAAFDALFMEFATDDKAAAEFIKGIMPSDVAAEVTKAQLAPPNIQPAENLRPPAPPSTSPEVPTEGV